MPHKFPPRALAQTPTPLLTTGPDSVFVTVEEPQSSVLPSTANTFGGMVLPKVDSNRPRSRGIALTDTTLRGLKAQSKPYKVTDGAGLYVVVSPARTKTFRYDYRLDGKRETLTVGRYAAGTDNRTGDELKMLGYGSVVSLKDARLLRDRASRQVEAGVSPSKSKVEMRTQEADSETFGAWARRYFEFKADPKSGDEMLADTTLAMRKSVYMY